MSNVIVIAMFRDTYICTAVYNDKTYRELLEFGNNYYIVILGLDNTLTTNFYSCAWPLIASNWSWTIYGGV